MNNPVGDEVSLRDAAFLTVKEAVATQIRGAATSFFDNELHRKCLQTRRAHKDTGIEFARGDQAAKHGNRAQIHPLRLDVHDGTHERVHVVSFRIPPAGADVGVRNFITSRDVGTLPIEESSFAFGSQPHATQERIVDDGGKRRVTVPCLHCHAKRGHRKPAAKRYRAVNRVQVNLVPGASNQVVALFTKQLHMRVVGANRIADHVVDGLVACGQRRLIRFIRVSHAHREIVHHDFACLLSQVSHEDEAGVSFLVHFVLQKVERFKNYCSLYYIINIDICQLYTTKRKSGGCRFFLCR